MKLIIVLFLFWFIELKGQKSMEINGFVKDSENIAIPFARIMLDKSKWVLANSRGEFVIRASEKDILEISCIGFQKRTIEAYSVLSKKNIVLEKANFINFEKRETRINCLSNNRGKIKKLYFTGFSHFIEGTVIRNTNLKNKRIRSVEMKLGYKGDSIIPFRLGIFRVGENGFPKENLLKKEVIIFPSKKFKIIEVNLEDQNLICDDNKIFVSLEFLNPSTNNVKLNRRNTPIMGVGGSNNQNSFSIVNNFYKWSNIRKTSAFFNLELCD